MNPEKILISGLSKQQADEVVADLRRKSTHWLIQIESESDGTFTVTAELLEYPDSEPSAQEDFDPSIDHDEISDSGDDEP
jgi:hypothetical protein